MAFKSRKNKIYVFHEFGAKSHYRALNWYIDTNKNFILVFNEFNISRKLIKGLISLDFKLVFKQFQNICFIIEFILTNNKIVIIGIAPYDWRLMLYYPLLRRHKYFYHTSNTDWGYTKYPKKVLATMPFSKITWKKFIENSCGIFCVTQKTAKGILDFYNVSNITVVNHSVLSSYVFRENEISFNKKSDRLNCLFVGSITAPKGIGLIFKLIEILKTDQFTFTFVGEGNLQDQLKEFIKYRENCCYSGYIENPKLIEYFEAADVLLFPSIKTTKGEERFGMSIIEAMACGTIPIATSHAGPTEIIKNNFSGFLFSEEEYVEKTIERLNIFALNDELVLKTKRNAYNESKKYREDQIFKKWNQLLKF